MKKISRYKLPNSRRYSFLMAIIIYGFFTVFYMGPSTWMCTDTLSGLGDNTGGPIWRSSIEPSQPILGGPQSQTNYPFGENLYSPVGFVSVIQTTIIRGLDAVAGPVCAYNIFNILGYLTTSMVVFSFLLYLIKNRWLAILGGYAAAFTPYIQSKVGGHPSYGFASLLLAVFWLTLHIIKKRRYKHGIFLSLVLAICAYFDPYFILLSVTVLVPTLFMWFSVSFYEIFFKKESSDKFFKTFKVFTVSFVLFIALVSPLAYLRVYKSDQISASTGPTRGDVAATAALCSNLLADYIIPDPYNPNFSKIFGKEYISKNISFRNWCGPGESRVSISLTMISIIIIGTTFYILMKRRNKAIKINTDTVYPTVLVVGSVLLVITSAFLIGLPPSIGGIITPSGAIIKLTETWRIFAREYLVLNIFVVILFVLMMNFLSRQFYSKFKLSKIAIFAAIFILIMFEYQLYAPFETFNFSYKRDVPSVYLDIKNNKDIKALAEYPIDRMGVESDVVVYYTTMQVVHKKPILNSALIDNPNENLHVSIKDLSDPQTIPLLRGLGIDYITIHGLEPEEILSRSSQIDIIKSEIPPVFGLTMLRKSDSNEIVLARIKPGPSLKSAIVIKNGDVVNLDIMKSPVDIQFEIVQDTIIGLQSIGGNTSSQSMPVCFDVRTSGIDETILEVYVNDKIQYQAEVGPNYIPVRIQASSEDKIRVSNSNGYNLRLDNLGCNTEK